MNFGVVNAFFSKYINNYCYQINRWVTDFNYSHEINLKKVMAQTKAMKTFETEAQL